jgi:hypothetical protein
MKGDGLKAARRDRGAGRACARGRTPPRRPARQRGAPAQPLTQPPAARGRGPAHAKRPPVRARCARGARTHAPRRWRAVRALRAGDAGPPPAPAGRAGHAGAPLRARAPAPSHGHSDRQAPPCSQHCSQRGCARVTGLPSRKAAHNGTAGTPTTLAGAPPPPRGARAVGAPCAPGPARRAARRPTAPLGRSRWASPHPYGIV